MKRPTVVAFGFLVVWYVTLQMAFHQGRNRFNGFNASILHLRGVNTTSVDDSANVGWEDLWWTTNLKGTPLRLDG
jgi:hypothetical protein